MSAPQEIIRKKRNGQKLSEFEIHEFFEAYIRGEIADYQVTAMLMAIILKGMNHVESACLTKIMRDSGKILQWNYPKNIVVDKHSTGGIGDKTSLVILPLCVLEGLKVPMISGRGLGHTGGTLDKLEAIPGMNVKPSAEQARKIVEKHGGVFMGQTEELAPLDKKLYALRDVTATVESVSLITASILSKKTAEGIGSLVMDVKYGSGAFMQDKKEALNLAQSLAMVGRECGLRVSCFLTTMNSPLGTMAGNALEIKECIEILKGGGPKDTKELVLSLTAEMVHLAFPKRKEKEIRNSLENNLKNGKAFEVFCNIIAEQGGDRRTLEDPSKLPAARYQVPVLPKKSSRYVQRIDVRALGIAIMELGGGRKLVTDKIDPAVGLTGLKHVGEGVAKNEPIAIIHANDESRAKLAHDIVQSAYVLGTKKITENLIWKKL